MIDIQQPRGLIDRILQFPRMHHRDSQVQVCMGRIELAFQKPIILEFVNRR